MRLAAVARTRRRPSATAGGCIESRSRAIEHRSSPCAVASGRMLPSDCPFCEHKNPVGAKFCNECGSPLSLAPCQRCGAINNLMDADCQRCGAPLPRPRAPGEPAPAEAEFARAGGESRTLEQDIALIEEGLRELGQASGSPTPPDVAAAVQAKQGATEPGQAPGRPTVRSGAAVAQVKQGAPELGQEDSTVPGGATMTQAGRGVPEFGQAPGSPTFLDLAVAAQVHQGASELAQGPAGSTLPDPATVARVEELSRKPVRNRGGESPFAGPAMPPLRARVDARWQEPLAIAMFVVAIAGGGYLSYRLGALPARETLTGWLGWLRADAPDEPRATNDAPPAGTSGGAAATPSPAPVVATPAEPRAASKAPSAGASGGAGATPSPEPRAPSDAPTMTSDAAGATGSPTPRAIVAPREPGVASDAPPASAKGPAPAAAPQPTCPPAVAAMALCHAYRP